MTSRHRVLPYQVTALPGSIIRPPAAARSRTRHCQCRASPHPVSCGSIALGIDTLLVTRNLGRKSQFPSEHINSQVFIRLASDVTTGARYQGNHAELKGLRDRQSVLALPCPDPAKIAHATAANCACTWVHGRSCPDIMLAPACSHW